MEKIISILAVVLSTLSLFATVVNYVITYRQNKKISRINMNARIYNAIFDELLIERIPKARTYLRFVENHLVDSEALSDALTDLMSRILYFRYADKGFYENIHGQISKLEDYVLECGNGTYVQEEQGEVYVQIQHMLEEIYKTVEEHYVGG